MEWKKKSLEMNSRLNEIENILKGEHGQRKADMVKILQSDRNPENYLKNLDNETTKYAKITSALRIYFHISEEKEEVYNK